MQTGDERSPAVPRESRLAYDFLEVLDMLSEEGMGDLGDDLPAEPNAKTAAVRVIKKHPVGCRQRNVARPMVCPSLDRDYDSPFLKRSKEVMKELVDKDQREPMEYLKTSHK